MKRQRVWQISNKKIDIKRHPFFLRGFFLRGCLANMKRPRVDHKNDKNAGEGGLMEQLPEEVIQCILSYLKRDDAIRFSVLCKKLYTAWSLHPILKLHYEDEEVSEEFVNYVNKSFERYLSHNQCPQQIDLTMNHEIYSSSSTMIDNLLQKFEEAGVGAIRVFYTSLDQGYDAAYLNLFRVLECKSLMEFNAERGMLMKERIGKEIEIRCSLLKRLILDEVRTDDDTIQSIISACQSIENLQLRDCSNLKKIKVVNHNCLKEIAFVNNYRSIEGVPFVNYSMKEVEVEVPSLESFFAERIDFLRGLESYPYQNMKTLSLRCTSISYSFFWDFASKFPNLEDFSAVDCTGYEGVNISGNSLKYVTLRSLNDRRQPEINAPNLVSFIYECPEIPCFVSTIASRTCECKLDITMNCLRGDSFFIQLKETLKRLIKSKISLSISFGSISNIENIEWPSNDSEPGVEVDYLNLYKTEDSPLPSRTYSAFLDNLFWSCRPKSICLDRFANKFANFDKEFGKVFCQRLMDKRIKSKFGSWENDLKGVKVEMINEINKEVQLLSIEDWMMLEEIHSQFFIFTLEW